MREYRTIAQIKKQTKEQLLGNYSVLTGSFVVLFVIIYALTLIISGAVTGTMVGGTMMTADVKPTLSFFVMYFVVMMLIGLFTMIFTVGYMYQCMKVARGQSTTLGDMFYVFKHHPDKVLIIGFVQLLISYILVLPQQIMLYYPDAWGDTDNDIWIWLAIYIAEFAIIMIISLSLGMSFLVYFDNPDYSAIACMKESVRLMKGNKLRLFGLGLSLIGMYLLGILSLGVGLMWLMPYMSTATVNFYRDLIGEDDNTSNTVGSNFETYVDDSTGVIDED